MEQIVSPFHEGEQLAQQKAGAGDVAKWAGGFIRDHLPDQHRAFHSALPFLVVSSADLAGRNWVTLLEGAPGFIRSPDSNSLKLDPVLDAQDPLYRSLISGTDIGALGIDLSNRRRNRFSGRFRRETSLGEEPERGYTIDINQTFGNCPQYIHERSLKRLNSHTPAPAQVSSALTLEQIARIRLADTVFLGSGHHSGSHLPARGFDASHRGGVPGFIHVSGTNRLTLPDYAGNNFFNTIGNLMGDPRIGLVFVDFETGGLLHLTGRATIDWQAHGAHDPDAQRLIHVDIEEVIDRPNALSLRWHRSTSRLRLRVGKIVEEARGIRSLYLQSADGHPLPRFAAGQHLPIELVIPDRDGPVKRSYSLSGDPTADTYRLTIKREHKGLVSGFIHDDLDLGSTLEASPPSGDFTLPPGDTPLVLVSAGVGLTPMVSMLHSAAKQTPRRPIWFVHGTQNSATHALAAEVEARIAALKNGHLHLFYSAPKSIDMMEPGRLEPGWITAGDLLGLGAGPAADYMLCGPAAFMSEIQRGLESAGIPSQRIHTESFGPKR